MKRIGLLILTILAATTLVTAQGTKSSVDMAFDKTVNGVTSHDFGSIIYGANGKVEFTFTNNGTKPLVITEVKSSCGCTIPSWTKEPVEPGKTGVVKVEYNTTLPGVFNKTVVVHSNANNSPVRLEIRGKVNSQPSDLKMQNTGSSKPKSQMLMDPGADGTPAQKTIMKTNKPKPTPNTGAPSKKTVTENQNAQTTTGLKSGTSTTEKK